MLFSWIDFEILVASLAAVVGGVHLVQRWIPHNKRREHNDAAAAIFTAIGAFYAILLTFVIVSLWTNASNARQVFHNEANDLAAVYWLSREMPVAQGSPLERLTLEYAHTVIDQEWPMMAREESSPAATRLVHDMRDEAFAMKTDTPKEQAIFQEVTGSVTTLAADRRARLDVLSERMPGFLWACLVGGGVLVVGFTFFFGMPSVWSHVAMAASLTVMVVGSLVLIHDLNFAFAGPGRIGPEAFKVFLSHLPPPR